MSLKFCILFFITFSFGFAAGSAVSDLNYVPLDGEFAGRTNINFYRDTTIIELSGNEFILETDQRTVRQSFLYGLTPWISGGFTIPFVFNGSSSIDNGQSSVSNALNSDLGRSIFTLTAQFGPEEQAQSFLSASFQESETDSRGFYSLSYALRKKLELSSYFLEFQFSEIDEDLIVEKQMRFTINFLMQIQLKNGFFLRPGFSLTSETDLIFKDTDEVLENEFILEPSLSLGQEVSDYHFYWLVGYSASYSKLLYRDSFGQERGENLFNNLEFEFGYRF